MDSRKNYAIVQIDGDIRMVDARLLRVAGPFIDVAIKILDVPWVERLVCRFEGACSLLGRMIAKLAAKLPHSREELLDLASRSVNAFRGSPAQKPALMGLILAALFVAELGVMVVREDLRLPDYPLTVQIRVEEQTSLDRMLAKEIQRLYAGSLGREIVWAKLTPPLPAFVETMPCSAEKASALLRIKWPALKLPVTAEVRRAVRMSAMRMPVDQRAFHPRDKASILRADEDRLRPVLAAVAATQKPLVVVAASSEAHAARQSPFIGPKSAQAALNGRLSALFESGDKGVFAIGYDPKGGTSYGKYQLSSRKGSMAVFIKYLDKFAPHWAAKLRKAGHPNSGYSGGPVARQWKLIASESPKKFEYLQDRFVYETYYLPAKREVMARAGVDVSRRHGALQELLWSTAVQHGASGGADIFVRAAHRVRHLDAAQYNTALVEEIFRQRELTFRRAPVQVKSGVQRRLKQEKNMALAMLNKPEPPLGMFKNL